MCNVLCTTLISTGSCESLQYNTLCDTLYYPLKMCTILPYPTQCEFICTLTRVELWRLVWYRTRCIFLSSTWIALNYCASFWYHTLWDIYNRPLKMSTSLFPTLLCVCVRMNTILILKPHACGSRLQLKFWNPRPIEYNIGPEHIRKRSEIKLILMLNSCRIKYNKHTNFIYIGEHHPQAAQPCSPNCST